MKIYNVEKERLQLFIDRYENFIKTAPFVKKNLVQQIKTVFL